MKKIVIVTLAAAALAVSLTGCSDGSFAGSSSGSSTTTVTTKTMVERYDTDPATMRITECVITETDHTSRNKCDVIADLVLRESDGAEPEWVTQ